MNRKNTPALIEPWLVPVTHDERRSVTRYRAAEGRAHLGWWDGPEFREHEAALLDVSQSGALVDVEAVPAEDVPIWLRLAGAGPGGWVEGRVVPSHRPRTGARKVGLEFANVCPYDFFKAAVFGGSL